MKTTTLIALAAAGAFAYVVLTKKAQAAATGRPVSNLNNDQQSAAPSRVPLVRFAAQDPKSLVTQVNANQASPTDVFSYLFPNL